MSGRRRQAVGVVSTQSEQAFEAMTILSKAKAFAVIVQKWPEASLL